MRSFGKNYWKDADIYENDFILLEKCYNMLVDLGGFLYVTGTRKI